MQVGRTAAEPLPRSLVTLSNDHDVRFFVTTQTRSAASGVAQEDASPVPSRVTFVKSSLTACYP